MPSVTQVLILIAASLAVAIPLLHRTDAGIGTEALITFGKSRPPTFKRIVAATILAFGLAFGFYVQYVNTQSVLSIALIAPFPAFVLLFHVVSSRFAEKVLIRPFLVYVGALAIAWVGLLSIPRIWQAFSTETIRPVWPPTTIDVTPAEAFVFWWSVFAYCAWVSFVIACLRLYLLRRRLGLPLSKYDPSFEPNSSGT